MMIPPRPRFLFWYWDRTMKFIIAFFFSSVVLFVFTGCADANELHEAVIQGDMQQVAMLVKEKPEFLAAKDEEGLTPLHYACAQGDIDCIMLLVASGGDLETKDGGGRTARRFAEWAECAEVITRLLDEELDVNGVDDNGDTLLHCVAWSNAPRTVESLIKKGAQIDIANAQGKTPVDYAHQAGHDIIVEKLIANGAVLKNEKNRTMTEQKINTGSEGLKKAVTFTILYDNYLADEGTRTEWGFACLVEGAEKTILFDTGGDPEVLMHNVRHTGTDLTVIDEIVISHNHWDHKGGLDRVMKDVSNPAVFYPYSFPFSMVRNVELAGGSVVAVNDPVELCPHVFSTGQMGDRIKEQSLIVNLSEGLVIVTGCSHQGIAEIVEHAKALFEKEVLLVFGGFHLMRHSEEQVDEIIKTFRECGVKKCGATHCTGDDQIAQFKKAFGEDYIPMGTGRKIVVSEGKISVSP